MCTLHRHSIVKSEQRALLRCCTRAAFALTVCMFTKRRPATNMCWLRRWKLHTTTQYTEAAVSFVRTSGVYTVRVILARGGTHSGLSGQIGTVLFANSTRTVQFECIYWAIENIGYGLSAECEIVAHTHGPLCIAVEWVSCRQCAFCDDRARQIQNINNITQLVQCNGEWPASHAEFIRNIIQNAQ